jgi:hypothetical protein
VWQRELKGDIDADFLLEGIHDGFHIVDKNAPIQPAEMDNYRSALSRRSQVKKHIKQEILEGRYVSCNYKPELISAFSAIDKANGKDIRLITDCSQPKGSGALNICATLSVNTKY